MTTEFKYLKEGIIADLAEFLMEDYQVGIDSALDIIYTSDTFNQINNPHTGLYFQGSKYVYSFLQEELKRGDLTA